jgi:predicted nuclease with RNAse H fold
VALGGAAPVYLGIDLAGVEHRETGVALLRGSRLELLTTAHTDADLLDLAARAGPDAVIAINAPLTLPRGRCCLDDDCRCRHDPGTRSRQIERDLLRLRVPTLATALIVVLARRGIRLAAALRAAGWEPLEVYPYATLRLLGLPTAGKRTPLGRRRIHQALQPLVPGLDRPDASEHQLDAVVCAYTALLWRAGRTRTVGDAAEGCMVIPDTALALPATNAAWEDGRDAVERAWPARRVAEEPAAYAAAAGPGTAHPASLQWRGADEEGARDDGSPIEDHPRERVPVRDGGA